MNKTISIFIYLAFIAIFFSACSISKRDTHIEISQYKSVYTSSGKFTYKLFSGTKQPTVIMESNAGDGVTIWDNVINHLEINNTILLYNRAGYDLSISNTKNRTVDIIVDELREVLQELELEPPYILVSHSFGSRYTEYFAKKYPSELSGVVFIDPWVSNLDTICKNNGLDYCKPSLVSTYLYEELDYNSDNIKKLHLMQAYPNIPTVIISSYNTNFQEPKFMDIWIESHYEFLNGLENARHIICKNCGHYIHVENPHIINKAIMWILKNN